MAKENRPRALADNIGREDEGTLAEREDEATNDSGRAGPAESGKNNHDEKEGGIGGKAGGKGGPKSKEEIQTRHSHEKFGQSHGERVGPTPEVAGETANGEAEKAGEKNTDKADAEGDSGTVEQSGENISAGGIASQ